MPKVRKKKPARTTRSAKKKAAPKPRVRLRKKKAAARRTKAVGWFRGRTWWWKIPFKIAVVVFAVVGLGLLGVMVAYGAIAKRFDLDELGTMPERSVVYDRNGEVIGRLHGANRVTLNLSEVSPYFIDALLTREDGRFYKHHGVDYIGVARSMFRNLKSKRMVQGASTITMQLARNSFDLSEKSLHRKMIEVMLARRIEKKLTKAEILEHYVNRIFFGSGLYGVERASQAYFAKPAKDMRLDEAAMLAGIIRGPNRFSPFRHHEAAMRERDVVLERMCAEGVISSGDCATAKTVKTVVQPQRKTVRQDNYALDAVRRDLDQVLDVPDVEDGGLRIYTNIDLRLQNAAQRAMEAHLAKIEVTPGYAHETRSEFSRRAVAHKEGTPQKPDYLQGAFVAIDNKTGGILAIAGGRDQRQSRFNRALSGSRQVGSVFKPFVYAAAFDKGLLPGTWVDDGPLRKGEIPGTDGSWHPQNADRKFYGSLSAETGLVKSRNTMTVRVGNVAGMDRVLELAEQLGFGDSLRPSPQLYIGNLESDLKTVTSAYTVFPNKGRRVPAFVIDRIENRHGETFYRSATSGYPVVSPESSEMVSDILGKVLEPGGTGAAVRDLGFRSKAGGKTGTTDDYHDAWFIGYTDKVTCGVWVGLDRPRKIVANGYGSRLALPIWTEIMKGSEEFGWAVRTGPVKGARTNVELCRQSGLLASKSCRGSGFTYWTNVPTGVAPSAICSSHGLIRARKAEPVGAENRPRILRKVFRQRAQHD